MSEIIDPTITIEVTGMTCQNCVGHVSDALKEVPGVKNVSVELVNGGTSTVTVVTDDANNTDFAPLEDAVADAGYDVVTIHA